MKIVNLDMVGQKVATAHGVQTVQPDGTLEVDEAGSKVLCQYAGFKPVGKSSKASEAKKSEAPKDPEAKKPEAPKEEAKKVEAKKGK